VRQQTFTFLYDKFARDSMYQILSNRSVFVDCVSKIILVCFSVDSVYIQSLFIVLSQSLNNQLFTSCSPTKLRRYTKMQSVCYTLLFSTFVTQILPHNYCFYDCLALTHTGLRPFYSICTKVYQIVYQPFIGVPANNESHSQTPAVKL